MLMEAVAPGEAVVTASDSEGSAGSMIFRANADGTSGYYLNLDLNMKSIRLFYKKDGRFEDQQVLAKVPRFVLPEMFHHIKIVAEGLRIRIDVDGEHVIDLEEGTFTEGHMGVNVFGGQAFYQYVRIEPI